MKVKVDIVTSDDIKIYYTGKFQDFTDRYMIIVSLFLCRYILSQSITSSVKYNEDTSSYSVVCHRNEQSSKLDFVHFMIEEMRRQLDLASENFVKASKQYPVHGLYQKCLTLSQTSPGFHVSAVEVF